MSTINEIQDEIIEEFSVFDDWMDKYQLLIDMGNGLDNYDNAYRTPEYLIEGCQSRVWIHATKDAEGNIHYEADSDAIIVKGIAALLIRVLSNQKPEDILNEELYFIDQIGLKQHLSPTRSNGLFSMLKQMKMDAVALSNQ